MPNYDYHCTDCGHKEEVFQKITEDALTKCPKCKKESFKRGPGGGIGLSFKGSGFYVNDYAPNQSQSPSDQKPPSCCPCGKNKNDCSSK